MTDNRWQADEHEHQETWFVVLHSQGSVPPRTRSGTPVDLDTEELPDDIVAQLIDEDVIVLSAPVDLPSDALGVIRSHTPIPPAFQRSGWLRDHHVLILADGHWEHAGVRVATRPDRSLRITAQDVD
ncbi:hypothetical protein [Nocardiopsis aegyptia]|uniref:Cas3 C-terminal domain-containing protein n=1 Tax=Nocardiopsis aegyptia TaxID=220378 RepID=A0A7Z0J8Y9_9ACTN|nr:hypothetical protein [Nocardiopsis aegyptia]NYJ32805.1 hypothetical protein [Nocardiopsis aegyptia]